MDIEPHSQPRAANHVALTPLDLLARTVETHPERPAVAWHDRRWTYAQFLELVLRFRALLKARGIGAGDVVSVMMANRPEMLAAHFAVPMVGGVLNTINTRLDAATVAYILENSETRLLVSDPACAGICAEATGARATPRIVMAATDEPAAAEAGRVALIDDDTPVQPIALADEITDEWQPICINYTSGTTGKPKGVVYHHRGAYLNALGNVMTLRFDPETVYLWTLPMFHCNGWCHTWAVTAAGGLHVCQDRVDPGEIFDAIHRHGVTLMACAPVVLYMLLNSPEKRPVRGAAITVATGGAAPTAALIEQMDALGFGLVHLYGLTESYGPASICELRGDAQALDARTRARMLARQGLRHITASQIGVIDDAGRAVPADGATPGEIVLRGNTLMAGYYHDAAATEKAFGGGHFHTGDIAVRHADGQIEIKDRLKDVIISGGENISSLEIESVLHSHPDVLLAAVVAKPHEKWGETPCAFIELKPGATADAAALTAFCRDKLPRFKVPTAFVFEELPKTATGKIQKFALRERAATQT